MARRALLGLTLIGLLAAGSAFAAPGVEWRKIPEGQAKISFQAPGFDEGVGRFFRGESPRGHVYTKGVWVGSTGSKPFAQIELIEPAPNFRLRAGRYVLREFVERLQVQGRKIEYGEESTGRNGIGRIIYANLTMGTSRCLGFAQMWREFGGRETSLVGFYCTNDATEFSDETVRAVLDGVGVRGKNLPAE